MIPHVAEGVHTKHGMDKDNDKLPPSAESGVGRIALPTLLLGAFATLLWCFAFSGYTEGGAGVFPTVACAAIASFLMFTVLHETSHDAVSNIPWLNALIGRFSMLFVAAYGAYPLFRYVHENHHWHTNETSEFDPDSWVLEGPAWQRLLRFATIDLAYLLFYARHYTHRPVRELREAIFVAVIALVALVFIADAGHLSTLVICYLIPQRIALTALAWWFDWLPHHGLSESAKSNRFRATRNRLGLDWLMTPIMLGQNYHLVHHLSPSVPFYRLQPLWREHEQEYLSWNPALSYWFGGSTADENDNAINEAAVAAVPAEQGKDRGKFYSLKVAEVCRLTADSATVTFEVPDELRSKFRFRQGQHITLRTDLGGEGVRRNYSICSSALSGEVRIAVKHIEGGAFSTHVMEKVKAGDVFDVMPPSGRFFTQLDASKAKTYVGIAGGSGITPIFSILSSVLEVEQESRFILLYANQNVDTIMFRDELRAIKQANPNRFQLLHFLSREPQIANYLMGSIDRETYSTELPDSLIRGRLDRYKLSGLMHSFLKPEQVDEWFLCGPEGQVTELANTLGYHGVDDDAIHKELFVSGTGRKPGGTDKPATNDKQAEMSSVSVACQDKTTVVELAQGTEFILDAAMRERDDLPYACQSGACGTCRARLTNGSVDMAVNMALDEQELEAGYILTCQSRPTSAEVTVDFDQ